MDRALYGLQESPHSWSLDRDSKLRQLTWKNAKGEGRKLVMCESDACIWKVITPQNKLVGTLGVFVDDFLFMAEATELEPMIEAIRKVWECSPTEYADTEKGLSFCSIQIVQRGQDLWIHQEKYIEELASRYGHLKPSSFLPDFKVLPEGETPTASSVRSAQKIIGELTWIAGRSRADISYAVNRMSRMTTVMPKYAYACGEQIIRFLLQTKQLRMKYSATMSWPTDLVEALPQTRKGSLLESFCDASFAQQDSKSQSGVIIMLAGQVIAWASLQQPCIAMSTAEAEMIACTEGVALAQALRPWIEELLEMECDWLLLNDSVACSSILSYPSGSWRTRHLRLRSKALQEMISDDILSIHHIPGRYMSANLLTKPLSPSRVWELWEYSGFDTTAVELPRKAKTKGSADFAPTVRVIMVSLLVTPAKLQDPFEVWTAWALGLRACMGLIVVIGVLGYLFFCNNHRRSARRLRQIAGGRSLADCADTAFKSQP